eukprot:XP_001704422.1 Hypothetical protein GL50803_9552 [Giardia lamblia ATCC 50803]
MQVECRYVPKLAFSTDPCPACPSQCDSCSGLTFHLSREELGVITL